LPKAASAFPLASAICTHHISLLPARNGSKGGTQLATDVYIGVFEELESGGARNLNVVGHEGAGKAEKDAVWVARVELR